MQQSFSKPAGKRLNITFISLRHKIKYHMSVLIFKIHISIDGLNQNPSPVLQSHNLALTWSMYVLKTSIFNTFPPSYVCTHVCVPLDVCRLFPVSELVCVCIDSEWKGALYGICVVKRAILLAVIILLSMVVLTVTAYQAMHWSTHST